MAAPAQISANRTAWSENQLIGFGLPLIESASQSQRRARPGAGDYVSQARESSVALRRPDDQPAGVVDEKSLGIAADPARVALDGVDVGPGGVVAVERRTLVDRPAGRVEEACRPQDRLARIGHVPPPGARPGRQPEPHRALCP